MIKEEIIIFTSFTKNILLNKNNLLFLKKTNNNIALNHEEMDVAIGMIINPILLKKYKLITMFKRTEAKEI